MFKAFLSLFNPFVISKPKVSRRNILGYESLGFDSLYLDIGCLQSTDHTGIDEIRLKLLSFLSDDDIGLCTRCGQNQLRACLHGERVTLVLGELPYHPGQLYQLCWRVSSCMSFFDDPRFKKILKFFMKTRKIHEKRENIIIVDSSAYVLYWSKVSLRGGAKGRKGTTKVLMTLIWLNYPLKFSIKLHKTIPKSSNANIKGKRRDWNIQIYSKIY